MKDFKFLTEDNQLDAQEEWYRRRDNLIQNIENQYNSNQINERDLILKMRRDYKRWVEEYGEPRLNILQRVIKFLKKFW